MTHFKLPKSYYIRNLDDKNWIIAKKLQAIKTEKTKEYIHGYYQNLNSAYRSAVNLLALRANDLPELQKIIKKLEELKGHSEFQQLLKIQK